MSSDNGDDLAKADRWLAARTLNEFGDAPGTMYMGASPLFNEMTGEATSRSEYLQKKFPEMPWNESTASDKLNMIAVRDWLETNKLNEYGDPEGHMYMGGSPLFSETTGKRKTLETYLLEKFPEQPWSSSAAEDL